MDFTQSVKELHKIPQLVKDTIKTMDLIKSDIAMLKSTVKEIKEKLLDSNEISKISQTLDLIYDKQNDYLSLLRHEANDKAEKKTKRRWG